MKKLLLSLVCVLVSCITNASHIYDGSLWIGDKVNFCWDGQYLSVLEFNEETTPCLLSNGQIITKKSCIEKVTFCINDWHNDQVYEFVRSGDEYEIKSTYAENYTEHLNLPLGVIDGEKLYYNIKITPSKMYLTICKADKKTQKLITLLEHIYKVKL